MLGVGLHLRKRSDSERHHRHQHSERHRRHQHHAALAMEFEAAPWIPSSVGSMDEAALKARQRLQQKLDQNSRSSSSSRSNWQPTNEGNGKENISIKKKGGLGMKLLERSGFLSLKRHNEERNVCAVCLEDFKEEEEVIKLSCSHKYHSACLQPWLEAHGNCPYCRTPVHT